MTEKRTSIDPAIAQDMFDSAANAAQKGQAQFLTPPEVARTLCRLLPHTRPHIADLNCGHGALLEAAADHPWRDRIHLYGCDIQPESRKQKAESRNLDRVTADLTRFFPLLHAVDWRCGIFVLNPPWDLHWFRREGGRAGESEGCPPPLTRSPTHPLGLSCLLDSELESVRTAFAAHDGRVPRECIDSTVATLMMALDRLTEDGEGFLIANHATMVRLLGDPSLTRSPAHPLTGSPAGGRVGEWASGSKAPHAALLQHVWLWLVFDGNLMTGDSHGGFDHRADPFQTAVLYFARAHETGPGKIRPATLAELTPGMATTLRQRRTGATPSTYEWTARSDCRALWLAAAEEWQRLQKNRPDFNLWITADGIIQTHLNLYDERARAIDKASIARLHALNGKRPMDLVLMRAQRDELLWACGLHQGGAVSSGTASPFKVAPALIEAVQRAIQEYHAERAPLYPLPAIQRLGYLDEEDSIECLLNLRTENGKQKSHLSSPLSAFNFLAGRRYPLKSETVTVEWTEHKPNLAGEMESLELTGQELVLKIQDEEGVWRSFVDARHLECVARMTGSVYPLQLLADHFDIPDVPDVATVRPEEFQRHLRTLQELEVLCP